MGQYLWDPSWKQHLLTSHFHMFRSPFEEPNGVQLEVCIIVILTGGEAVVKPLTVDLGTSQHVASVLDDRVRVYIYICIYIYIYYIHRYTYTELSRVLNFQSFTLFWRLFLRKIPSMITTFVQMPREMMNSVLIPNQNSSHQKTIFFFVLADEIHHS